MVAFQAKGQYKIFLVSFDNQQNFMFFFAFDSLSRSLILIKNDQTRKDAYDKLQAALSMEWNSTKTTKATTSNSFYRPFSVAIPMDAMEQQLHTDPTIGLTTKEAQDRLNTYGPNALSEKKANTFFKFLSYFGGAISFLLEISAIVSAILGDWIDFGILIFILFLNVGISFIQLSLCLG